ncbi:hypothetical protein [Streptomyces sp. Z26]|uniref:hypothetical protein n=1 Tax=Streptomyces sp. Z26 TaxID=2500177 RepID=UPI000EF14433|nr:hypothetical protein [Streptomyces sp. Z26]RLL67334.1 hypothetical protein D7M15_11210 [Streptomyces sp. Z26]
MCLTDLGVRPAEVDGLAERQIDGGAWRTSRSCSRSSGSVRRVRSSRRRSPPAARSGRWRTCPGVDRPPATLVVAWPEHSRSRGVAALVRAAPTVAERRGTGASAGA